MTLQSIIAMASPSQGGSSEGSLISTLVMFAMIIGIFYFLILRPQQKRQKERERMLTAVKKGDKIITSGGIHGTVSGIDEKTVLVQIADNVKVKIDRSGVASVLREGETDVKEQK